MNSAKIINKCIVLVRELKEEVVLMQKEFLKDLIEIKEFIFKFVVDKLNELQNQ